MSDEDLLRELVEQNQLLVWRWVLADDRFHDLPCDEIVQNVLMTATRQWATTPAGEQVPRDRWQRWLFTLTANELRNAHRAAQRRRRRFTPIDDLPVQRQPRHDDPADDLIDELDLHTLLAGLPFSEKAILTLVVWHGLTPAEAAHRLGIRRTTAAMNLNRLGHKVRAVWAGDELKGAKRDGITRFAEALRRRGHG